MVMRLGRLVTGISVAVCFAASGALADGVEERASYERPFSWTGLYVGAHLGGGLNLIDVTDPLGPSLFGNPIHSPGPFAGLQAGYSYQSGIFVYGVEADLSLPQMEGTGTCSAVNANIINSTCRLSTDAFGTLTGRLGLALGPEGGALIYGKAGAAWSTGSFDVATGDMHAGEQGNPFAIKTAGLTQWGWTLGAGAEYALSSNWSVSSEYDFIRFGDADVTLLPTAYLSSAGVVTGTVPARQGQVSQDTHAIKLGLNYRFGEGGLQGSGFPQETTASLSSSPLQVAGLPIGLELGGRYWYSWGRHKYDLGFPKAEFGSALADISRLTYGDLQSNTGELFGRVTAPWNLFAKGFIGTGTTSTGHMNDEDFVDHDTPAAGDPPNPWVPYTNALLGGVSGDIPGYGTIDVGYDWWRSGAGKFGTYVGYNYYKERMGARGCVQLINQLGPCGLSPSGGGNTPFFGHAVITQEAAWQSLRLGAATEFYLVPALKLSADAAYLPYVSVDAEDRHYSGNTAIVVSHNPMEGSGVGTQLEVMLSYDVTEQISVGVGGRYWAMWTTDASERRTYNRELGGPQANPTPNNVRIETERLGVLGEVRYTFD